MAIWQPAAMCLAEHGGSLQQGIFSPPHFGGGEGGEAPGDLHAQALARMPQETLGEWVPFAARLAERVGSLVQAGVLPVGGGLWTLITEQLLLPVIDSDLQVRCPAHPSVPTALPVLSAGRLAARGWRSVHGHRRAATATGPADV